MGGAAAGAMAGLVLERLPAVHAAPIPTCSVPASVSTPADSRWRASSTPAAATGTRTAPRSRTCCALRERASIPRRPGRGGGGRAGLRRALPVPVLFAAATATSSSPTRGAALRAATSTGGFLWVDDDFGIDPSFRRAMAGVPRRAAGRACRSRTRSSRLRTTSRPACPRSTSTTAARRGPSGSSRRAAGRLLFVRHRPRGRSRGPRDPRRPAREARGGAAHGPEPRPLRADALR